MMFSKNLFIVLESLQERVLTPSPQGEGRGEANRSEERRVGKECVP